MNYVTKILLKAIHERIRNKINMKTINNLDLDFTKNKGKREAILSKRMVSEKYLKMKKRISMLALKKINKTPHIVRHKTLNEYLKV